MYSTYLGGPITQTALGFCRGIKCYFKGCKNIITASNVEVNKSGKRRFKLKSPNHKTF